MFWDRWLVVAFTVLAVGLGHPAAPARAEDYVRGEVTKVDESAGKITIKHGPLRNFGMDEGMTMTFRAGDPAMLKAVKAGDRIRFIPDLVDGQFTVKKVQKAK